MADSRRDGQGRQALRPVPPLPRSLADARPVVLVGTIAWFTAAVVLAIAGVGGDWIATCLTGGGLGLLGFLVMAWQRRASQRGARGAVRNLF